MISWEIDNIFGGKEYVLHAESKFMNYHWSIHDNEYGQKNHCL